MQIPAYRQLKEAIDNLVAEINWKYAVGQWKPIVALLEDEPQLTAYGVASNGTLLRGSSLHDGMNLVAKEFVASRFDEDGVLILSKFTGAARELTDALLINPYMPLTTSLKSSKMLGKCLKVKDSGKCAG